MTPESRLYLLAGAEDVLRRRALVPTGSVVEAWQDHHVGGAFWVGAESKALLDAVGTPMKPELSLPAERVPIYYGPQLCDLESLPREESVQARVLSAHGIAAAWTTLDRFGQRNTYVPSDPDDPVFHLRRVGGGTAHIWRLFRTRQEAVAWMREAHGADSEAVEWAQKLPAGDFDALMKAHARRGQ